MQPDCKKAALTSLRKSKSVILGAKATKMTDYSEKIVKHMLSKNKFIKEF